MNELYKILPRDLVNIVEEYAKDRTNYDALIEHFEDTVIYTVQRIMIDYNEDPRHKIAAYDDVFDFIFQRGILNRDFILFML
jgi:hypothetical protein